MIKNGCASSESGPDPNDNLSFFMSHTIFDADDPYEIAKFL